MALHAFTLNWLIDEGTQVGRKRVERLMKAAGIKRRQPPQVRNARRSGTSGFVPALRSGRPKLLRCRRRTGFWVADITYVPTWAGFLYLAVVLDAFSRRIVGWAMGHDLKTQLVLDALNMAIAQRKSRRT